MDATFLNKLRGLNYDELTMAQASEVMGALREAVAKGEAWFEKFSAGFVKTRVKMVQPPIPDEVFLDAAPKVTKHIRQGQSIQKRGRGRPRKVVPEIVSPTRQVRGGAPSDRDHSPPGASPADDHPPIGVLQGSYVSTTGPDPNRAYSLPATHPRAGGAAPPATGDADFAAVEAGKVRFQ